LKKAAGLGALDSIPGLSDTYSDVQNSQLMRDVNSFTMSDPEISSLANSHNPFEDTKKSNPVAYAFGNVLASLLLDAIPTAKLGLLDDAARGIKGFVSSKFDDLVALLKKASSATGKSGDDIVRLIAGATGKSSDDILRELAQATGKSVDDIVKAFAGVSGSGDDAARVLTAANGTTDTAASQADNLDAWVKDWNTSNTNSTFDGMSGKADQVPETPDPEFNKPLEDVPPKGYNGGTGDAASDILIDSYKNMRDNPHITGQAHHINQDAAFRDVIPRNDGLCLELEGNAFRDVGSPHYSAHENLESFWNKYRSKGDLHGNTPTISDYNTALFDSLRAAGLSNSQAKIAVQNAIRQQSQYGLTGNSLVPRIPGRITF
jgi:hypothetical protein